MNMCETFYLYLPTFVSRFRSIYEEQNLTTKFSIGIVYVSE